MPVDLEVESQPYLRRSRGVALGIATGFVALGCCVYPLVLFLLGAASASAAISLGYHLYGNWGWAFKVAAVILALGALAVYRRRARTCSTGNTGSIARMIVWTGLSAVITYAGLYVLTRGLASLGL